MWQIETTSMGTLWKGKVDEEEVVVGEPVAVPVAPVVVPALVDVPLVAPGVVLSMVAPLPPSQASSTGRRNTIRWVKVGSLGGQERPMHDWQMRG
jgi:hypothetical protein